MTAPNAETRDPIPFDLIVARFAEQALADEIPPIILIASLAGVSIDLALQSMGEEETRRWLIAMVDRLKSSRDFLQ